MKAQEIEESTLIYTKHQFVHNNNQYNYLHPTSVTLLRLMNNFATTRLCTNPTLLFTRQTSTNIITYKFLDSKCIKSFQHLQATNLNPSNTNQPSPHATSFTKSKSPPQQSKLSYLPQNSRKFMIWLILVSFVNWRYWNGPPNKPLACSIIGLNCPDWPIGGHVKPGFESVGNAFYQNFVNGLEVGASFVAYVGDEPVVDLFGGFHSRLFRKRYTNNTLQLVFSSSKAVEGIVIAYLVDKGLLRYDERIATYWPEFAQGGKHHVTLANLLGHRAGVTYLDKQPTLRELSDLDRMSELLAQQPHNFNGSTIQGYQAVTRGWYLNEIVRRVDGRTIGQVIRQDIMPALNIEYYLGLPQVLEKRISPLMGYPALRTLAKLLLPSRFQPDPLPPTVRRALFDRESLSYKATQGSSPRQIRPWPHSHNRREIWGSENPSYGGITNARSLARLAAVMANGGELDNFTLVKNASVLREAATPLPQQLDVVLHRNISFSKGGWALDVRFPGVEEIGWAGWAGAGGSMIWWNEEKRIAFSYVMNSAEFGTVGDRRSHRLIKELVKSVLNSRLQEGIVNYSNGTVPGL